jgi:hypothetical protein
MSVGFGEIMLKYEIVISYNNDWLQHYRYGQYHRVNRPALLLQSGYIAYYEYGERHRKTYPARIWKRVIAEYWVRGQQLSIFDRIIRWVWKNVKI